MKMTTNNTKAPVQQAKKAAKTNMVKAKAAKAIMADKAKAKNRAQALPHIPRAHTAAHLQVTLKKVMVTKGLLTAS